MDQNKHNNMIKLLKIKLIFKMHLYYYNRWKTNKKIKIVISKQQYKMQNNQIIYKIKI